MRILHPESGASVVIRTGLLGSPRAHVNQDREVTLFWSETCDLGQTNVYSAKLEGYLATKNAVPTTPTSNVWNNLG